MKAQCLGAFAALAEDEGSVPSIHNSSSGVSGLREYHTYAWYTLIHADKILLHINLEKR